MQAGGRSCKRMDLLCPLVVRKQLLWRRTAEFKPTRPQTELAACKTLASQTFSGLTAGCSGLAAPGARLRLLRCRPCKQWL